MPPGPEFVLLTAHAFATLFMTGLIWFVQIVHYPLLRMVGAAEFRAYEKAHQFRTTLIVAPMMLLEAMTAGALVLLTEAGFQSNLALIGLLLLAAIWLSTALVQGPVHQRLTAGLDDRLLRLLLASNWLRTILWTARSALALLLLASA